MAIYPDRRIYGLTGEIGRDGVLTPDLLALLNQKQHEAAQAVLNHLEKREPNGHFPIAAMATGIGKTRVEHEVIETWRRSHPGAKILFIAGTKLTLVEQARSALTGYQEAGNGSTEYTKSEELERDTEETENVEEAINTEQEDLPFYRVGKFRDIEADVRVATIQTIQSAYKRGRLNSEEFDLVLVDEVHNIGTEQRVAAISQFNNVIGFTATPYRHSGEMKKPEDYGFEVAYSFPLLEAQEARLLPPLLGMQVATTGLVERIPITPSGQIDYRKLEKILKNSPELRPFIANKVAEIVKDGDKEYKTVIAVNFVWEAEELAQLLKAKGIRVGVAVNQLAARQIHSDYIPAIGTIDRYKLSREDPNSLQVLISPYVASEGFDAPFTEVLVWASPTDSPLRYTQYVGRLARRSEGKLFGFNLDFLYQTSQYGWSYNMGMWMKGSVRQLPSGLLYLGPEGDITGLAELDVVRAIRRKGETVEIASLQEGIVEDMKETDLSLSLNSLTLIFRGGDIKISPFIQQVRTQLESEHPEYFVRRLYGRRVVEVITIEGRQAFIDAMITAGAELKDGGIEDIKETDLLLTQKGLRLFRGDWDTLSLISSGVKDKLATDHPEYFAKRKHGAALLDVVTIEGREAFIQAMFSAGVEVKNLDINEPDENDLPLTQDGLAIFRGADRKLKSIALLVEAQLRQDHPEYFARRKNGSNIYKVVTYSGRQAFIDAMIAQGAELKVPELEDLKEGDLILAIASLKQLFRAADWSKSLPIVSGVKAQLESDHPEYFAKRKNKKRISDVVTAEGREAFIEAMIGVGFKLQDQSIQETQCSDFSLVIRDLQDVFKGDPFTRIAPIAREVKIRLEKECPQFFIKRRSGIHIIDVVISEGKEIFIKALLEAGLELR